MCMISNIQFSLITGCSFVPKTLFCLKGVRIILLNKLKKVWFETELDLKFKSSFYPYFKHIKNIF